MAEHIEVLRIELVNVERERAQDNNEVGNLLKYGGKNKKIPMTLEEKFDRREREMRKVQALAEEIGIVEAYKQTLREIEERRIAAVKKIRRGERIKTTAKITSKSMSLLGAGTSIAGRYISDTQSLSGATHAAERTQKLSNAGLFVSGVGLSVATGNYWAMVLMLAGRAVQFGLENRKEIYKMKLDRTVSALKQERLVKDTTHRLSNTK